MSNVLTKRVLLLAYQIIFCKSFPIKRVYPVKIFILTLSYHCHSFGAKDLWDTESGVECNVGHDVDHHHQDDGDGDAPGQVLDWVLQLLYHKVEIIPAIVGKQARVEG